MKFNLETIRKARDYGELLANLNGLEAELRERLPKFGTIGKVILEEILGE